MSEKPIRFINPLPCNAPKLQTSLLSIEQIECEQAIDDTSMEDDSQ